MMINMMTSVDDDDSDTVDLMIIALNPYMLNLAKLLIHTYI